MIDLIPIPRDLYDSGSSILYSYLPGNLSSVSSGRIDMPRPCWTIDSTAKSSLDRYLTTQKLSGRFGTWFAALTIFVIGPLYMVPRMSAAAWAAIVQITGLKTDSYIPAVAFAVIFYLITYWFVSNPGKVIDKIGNILFPVLVIVVTAVIVKSIASPIASDWAAPSFTQNPVVHGFLEGYATADLQCALLFGIIVVQGIRNAGIAESAINRNLIKIGSCALSCVVSFADLDTIVRIIGPVLDTCYPAAIVVAMYYCLCRRPDDPVKLRAGKWAVISAFVISILQLAVRYSEMFDLGWNMLSMAYYALPLAEYSLAWLPVSLILYALTALARIRLRENRRALRII